MIDIDKQAQQTASKRVVGRLEAADGTLYEPSGTLSSFKIQATGEPLKTAMAQIDITLLGEHKLVGETLNAYYGTYNGSDYDYTQLGVFNILKAEYSKDEDVTKLVGYDNMVQLQRPYETISDYPTTLYGYLASLAAGVGVTLATTEIHNGALDIPEDYYVNIPDFTFRDVLKEICEVAASSARMNAQGELEIIPLPDDTGETLTYDNLLEYDFSDDYGAINTVVLSRQPQNDDIVMQDDADINFPMTKNLLDLETAQVTYTMEEV